MQNSEDFRPDLSRMSLDEIAGDTLVGSGLETEEPEHGFSTAELDGEE